MHWEINDGLGRQYHRQGVLAQISHIGNKTTGQNCKVFFCTNRAEERHVMLKFRYAGNTQYHRVHEIDFKKFASLFSELSP
ncbi:hypothetical protein IWQ54_003736 [Labrenzia sp. EL_195]|nr:hypothetical protein [Labrenzia sp. EL_195]